MNKFLIIFGIILLSFSFITCDNGNGGNDTTHDHGDICYEHSLVYGIPVTGGVSADMDKILAGFTEFE